MGCAIGQLANGRTGHNGQQQVLPPQLNAISFMALTNTCGFTDNTTMSPASAASRLLVRGANAVPVVQVYAALRPGPAAQSAPVSQSSSANQAANHRFGHHAAANKGDDIVLKHEIAPNVCRRTVTAANCFQSTSTPSWPGWDGHGAVLCISAQTWRGNIHFVIARRG